MAQNIADLRAINKTVVCKGSVNTVNQVMLSGTFPKLTPATLQQENDAKHTHRSLK